MKTPSTHLFDLVKSLTKAQKRYIRVQAGSKGKDALGQRDSAQLPAATVRLPF